MAAPVRFAARGGDVCRRRVDVNGTRHGAVKKLVVNRADAGANVEQQQVLPLPTAESVPNCVDQEPGRASGAATTKTTHLTLRLPVVELLLDGVALAARHVVS